MIRPPASAKVVPSRRVAFATGIVTAGILVAASVPSPTAGALAPSDPGQRGDG